MEDKELFSGNLFTSCSPICTDSFLLMNSSKFMYGHIHSNGDEYSWLLVTAFRQRLQKSLTRYEIFFIDYKYGFVVWMEYIAAIIGKKQINI